MTSLKTVLVIGNFNVLHAGHLRLFKFARACGHLFMVGVNSDRIAGDSAYVNEALRLECVQHTNWVDEAFLVDEPLEELILRLRPDIIVKGKEYECRFNPEIKSLHSYGGKILFNSGETIFSSLDFVRKSLNERLDTRIEVPVDFLKRHKTGISQLMTIVNRFALLRVGIIGDLIIDEYINCEPLGMSQEDPTIVVTPIDSTYFLGGAAIVAAHAAGLGAQVEFVSVVGNDAMHDYAASQLKQANVSMHLFRDDERPTTLKQRFRSQGKTLLRVSHLHQGAISVELQIDITSIYSYRC
jgi:cytidyltransferase-like protein